MSSNGAECAGFQVIAQDRISKHHSRDQLIAYRAAVLRRLVEHGHRYRIATFTVLLHCRSE
ncbi:hypothetical protein [Cernens ardua]|uniref:hypothetical protein n=1 Tax=Cernens ardua TaxID=3402176 RepID=UPI003F994D8A